MWRVKKCKDITIEELEQEIIEKKEDEIIEEKLKTFSFPKIWISVKAKSLRDAETKMKMMINYKNKKI